MSTYYVSPSGADSNDGLSTGSPWQTIAHVNTITFSAGDSILFQGGQSFTGNLAFSSGGTTANPIVVSSYGTGSALLNAGTGAGIAITAASGFRISNLIVRGDGALTNTNYGVVVDSETASTAWAGMTITNVEVYGFGLQGIILYYANATSVDAIDIEHCYAHDNRQDGIVVGSYPYTSRTLSSVTVKYCKSINNIGDSTVTTYNTGSGIFVYNANSGEIAYNYASGNGGSCGITATGPVGIWIFTCNNVSMHHNDSILNSAAGGDGGGFDMDSGCTNCSTYNNFSYGNKGYGYLFYHGQGFAHAHSGCQAYNNVSINDGQASASYPNAGFAVVDQSTTGNRMTDATIYNNTVIQSSSIGIGGVVVSPAPSACTLKILNNVFVNTTGRVITFSSTSILSLIVAGNAYYGGASPIYYWGGTSYTSLSAFRSSGTRELFSAVNTGHEGDPQLSSLTGVTSSGSIQSLSTLKSLAPASATSACLTAGIDKSGSIASVTYSGTDLMGNTLAATSPAAGAIVAIYPKSRLKWFPMRR
ncbi:MAG: hypothetical protein KGL39_24820 [Patescibacteria group bacterium]|nr:hypothetical protein [Patescibacteria group bacterium]